MVTDAQVRRYREKRMTGYSMEAAAVAAGMSERTARRWHARGLPSQSQTPRTYRTRPDPFADVWATQIEPRLIADAEGRLQALTLFDWLREQQPGRFRSGQLRTLQRRVREWRARHGPAPEVFFEQTAVPGREAAMDFTDGRELAVTIAGEPFAHLWFEWVLSFSGWTYVELAPSETFEALVSGLQGALWTLGAAPTVVRHDNLTAATHELRRSGGRQLNARFRAVLDHYGLQSSRIQPGRAHENGVVEQRHYRTKGTIEQALLLRGHRDFVDEASYLTFVRELVDRKRNGPLADRLTQERRHLRPLPTVAIPSYTRFTCQVRRWSTILVGGRTYSVPSSLIGHTVEARQHAAVVEILYRGALVERMPRVRGDRDHRIDYRHIIAALVRKPGAFARYRFREELFPTLVFRRAYDALVGSHGERADIEYLRLLHLAATDGDSRVGAVLEGCLNEGRSFDYAAVQAQVTPPRPTIPVLRLPVPDLAHYDALFLGGGQ